MQFLLWCMVVAVQQGNVTAVLGSFKDSMSCVVLGFMTALCKQQSIINVWLHTLFTIFHYCTVNRFPSTVS